MERLSIKQLTALVLELQARVSVLEGGKNVKDSKDSGQGSGSSSAKATKGAEGKSS